MRHGRAATDSTVRLGGAPSRRAKYDIRTPDALHYAIAVEAGASVFLTGDRAAAAPCSEVPVEVL